MTVTLTPSEVRRLRLRAQGLSGEPGAGGAEGVVGVVDELFALQGQDLPGVLWSLGLRTDGADRSTVRAAFDAGALVRTWPFRGTLHVLAATDVGWVLALTGPRMIAAAARRRRELEIDEGVLEVAREVAARELAGGARVSRTRFKEALDEAGVPTAGQRGYHLISHLAIEGLIAFGPFDGAEQQLVLVADHVPNPRRLDAEEGMRAIVRRYLHGRGVATAADISWWSGLPVRAVRGAVAELGDEVEAVQFGRVEHLAWAPLLDVGAAGRRSASGNVRVGSRTESARPVLALPGFDELLLGYADRTATLAREHAGLIVPGGNGVFRRTLVHRGRVIGTWRAVEAAAGVRVVADTFGDVPRGVERGLAREASRYARFVGAPLREVLVASRPG